jgi:hypothetical protein
MDERNETNEKKLCRKASLISLISCNSFFSLFVSVKDRADTAIPNHAFGCLIGLAYPAIILESQPTQRGHRPLLGLAREGLPSNPPGEESHEAQPVAEAARHA